MNEIAQVLRLVLTTILLFLPPILLIAYGRKYGSLIWDSKPLMHGILMLFGFVSLLGTAVTSFKNLPIKSREKRKLVHAVCHTLCVVFMLVGWSQIYGWKNKNEEVHYLSVHSWLGVLTMIVFSLTYVAGAVLFNPYITLIKVPVRIAAKPYHIASGVGVTLLAAVTTTTGLYSFTDLYVPGIFKQSQTPALRLVLCTALLVALAFYFLIFSLGVIVKSPPQKVVNVKPDE